MNNLLVLETQKALENFKYPSPLAISKEIIEFTDGNERKIKKILKQIAKNKPWEQIRGYTFFKGYKIILDKNVLIPRIETEELVDLAIKKILGIRQNFQILEIGTGTGCISIALSKAFPKSKIIATDISKKALKIAKKNIKENNCENIVLKNANLLNFEFDKTIPTIIIANLPYIPSEKVRELDKSVVNYEPKIALDGGEKGYEIYHRLIKEIKAKDINFEFAIFEITKDNIPFFKKYSGSFHKDCFQNTRFFILNPFLPK
jgi:release factor glutamine methyltransferase